VSDLAAPALLPLIRTREEHAASPRDEATYRPAVTEICRRHGLPTDALRKYAGGSTIVFAVGDTHVVKLFEPIFPEESATESEVLRAVQGRLGVPTPEPVAVGEMEGWTYVVMTQLAGDALADVWDGMTPAEHEEVVRQVGAVTARLHQISPDGLPLPEPDWDGFLRRQAAGCVERQRTYHLGEPWLSQVEGFLAAVDLPRGPRVLMHTEIMREHVLVRRGHGGWEVTGIFDFEPAMAGVPEYEMASIGVFLCQGEPALLRAFRAGYGTPPSDGETLARRVMAYTLLHRYSRLSWYLDVIPPRQATTLDALALEWFGGYAAG
jgi:hygromycin-B 7''-O-kinase